MINKPCFFQNPKGLSRLRIFHVAIPWRFLRHVQVVKLKIVKHRAGLMYHLFKTKRAFHLKITQKLSDSENRRILIRKNLALYESLSMASDRLLKLHESCHFTTYGCFCGALWSQYWI